MPVTRLLRGPNAVAEAGQAIVCVGLELEADIVLKQFARDISGPNVAGLSEIVGQGCRGFVSFGLAGALSPELRAGDSVVASVIVSRNETFPTDDIWSSRLLSAVPAAIYGPIAGADLAVVRRAARGELGLRSGAIAVDTESHTIAGFAAAHSLPLVAIRVVIDPVHRNVPLSALACISTDGATKLSRLARLLLGRPADMLGIVRLCADWRAARAALVRSCKGLGASICGDQLQASPIGYSRPPGGSS